MSPEFLAILIQTMLTKMFERDSCLSICDLDMLWKAAGITPDPLTRESLRLLHCRRWTTMPDLLRAHAAVEVAKTFGWSASHDEQLRLYFAGEVSL